MPRKDNHTKKKDLMKKKKDKYTQYSPLVLEDEGWKGKNCKENIKLYGDKRVLSLLNNKQPFSQEPNVNRIFQTINLENL